MDTSTSLDVPNFHESGAHASSMNYSAIEQPCEDYEGVDDEDESSDDEYGSIQRPAFLVEGEPDFDSGPPLDGFEYLRRVRYDFFFFVMQMFTRPACYFHISNPDN